MTRPLDGHPCSPDTSEKMPAAVAEGWRNLEEQRTKGSEEAARELFPEDEASVTRARLTSDWQPDLVIWNYPDLAVSTGPPVIRWGKQCLPTSTNCDEGVTDPSNFPFLPGHAQRDQTFRRATVDGPVAPAVDVVRQQISEEFERHAYTHSPLVSKFVPCRAYLVTHKVPVGSDRSNDGDKEIWEVRKAASILERSVDPDGYRLWRKNLPAAAAKAKELEREELPPRPFPSAKCNCRVCLSLPKLTHHRTASQPQRHTMMCGLAHGVHMRNHSGFYPGVLR